MAEERAGTTVNLPFVGAVDAKALSLPLLTLVLAGMDAFNPCAFFVLLFLLSLLVHAEPHAHGDRRRHLRAVLRPRLLRLHGRVAQRLPDRRRTARDHDDRGPVALVVAALNIKDYLLVQGRAEPVHPGAAKPGLFDAHARIVDPRQPGPMLASTVVLAIVANSYELLCTAGFPMVYTRTLTLAGLGTGQYYA